VRFIFNSFFAVFLAFGASMAASLIGTDALGMDQAPQNAVVIRNGFAPLNPAVNAFENRTKFGAAIQYEHASAQSNSKSISLSSFAVPSMSMVLPFGFWGAFGIGLNQTYFASNRLEFADAVSNVSLSSRVGFYELTPSYSIRLPFFLSDFALGTSYRVFFGNSYSTLTRGKSKGWDEDSWMAKNVLITKKETSSFYSKDDWQKNFGYSLHFHKKSLDYFVSYFPSVQIQKNAKENIQFSNTDTLQARDTTTSFKLPKHFASGVHYRFWQNQNLSFVHERQNFEECELAAKTGNAFSWLAEYKITGTGLHYSPFLKRNNFGINAWYAEKYLKNVNEYGASLLSDMWLGRRGTLVGLSFFGGYRQAKEPYWDELFFGFELNLTGVGYWGTSARRR
jgi:long-chain fatty acid transport protein